MDNIIIGIDPGIEPAIAAVDNDGRLLGCMRIQKVGNEMNISGFQKYIQSFCSIEKHQHVYIEKAQAMPGQGVVSMFNYGKSFGTILGVLTAMGIPYTLVAPQTWKKTMLADMDRSDKNSSRLRAMQLWPDKAEFFKRKSDQHIAEAALIAEHGRTEKKHF